MIIQLIIFFDVVGLLIFVFTIINTIELFQLLEFFELLALVLNRVLLTIQGALNFE